MAPTNMWLTSMRGLDACGVDFCRPLLGCLCLE